MAGILALGAVLFWERSAGTLKSAEDVSEELDLTFLGAIRRVEGGRMSYDGHDVVRV